MTDRKKCVKCNRPIDAWARLCPFCNHDQNEPVPAVKAAPVAPVAEYVAPDDKEQIKRRIAIIGAGVLLLFVAFGIGMVINKDDTPKTAPLPVAERPIDDVQPSGKRASTQLIPMNEPLAQPITSAPVAQPDGNIPNEYQRHDATAVSSVEYQQLAARAQAEKKAVPTFADPRSMTGRAYAEAPRPRRTLAAAAAPQSNVTHPVAEYQPLPNVHVSESTTVRLQLTVGPDGRVQEIEMQGTVPRYTREVLEAVRRWRYKPATINGTPVAAPVTVDISFKGDE